MMKQVTICFLVLAAALVVRLALAPKDSFPVSRQEWRFRQPEITDAEVKARLAEDEGIRTQRRTAGFSSDASEQVRDELNLWEEQFHLGDADRQERLALRGLTKADMRQQIAESLQDEAFVESRLKPISEKAVRDWFEAHAEELRIPSLHHVHHIFLSRHGVKKPDRSAEMWSIHGELQRGTAFAALAAKHSEDARSKALGGDLGWISAARMPEDFIRQVEKLQIGKVSAPAETKLGWHLLLVTERRASRLPAFEEVREEITAQLDFEQRARVKP